MTDERDLVEVESDPEALPEVEPTGAPSEEDAESLKKDELKSLADKLGMDSSGTKDELIARLTENGPYFAGFWAPGLPNYACPDTLPSGLPCQFSTLDGPNVIEEHRKFSHRAWAVHSGLVGPAGQPLVG